MILSTFIARERALGLLLGMTIFAMTACTGRPPGDDKPWMTRIPNTERITGASGSMFVSPGEKWIAFFVGNDVGLAAGLASVEVASGRRIEHNLHKVSAADLGRFGRNPFSRLEANRGFLPGWHEGVLYLPDPGAPRDALIVVNSEPAIAFGRQPSDQLMVSDGPGWDSWYTELESRTDGKRAVNGGITMLRQYSAAWRNSRYDATTYAYDFDSRSIVAREPGGEVRKIVDLPHGGIGQRVVLSQLRVSPDESYLAYVLGYSSSLFLSPGMAEVVNVVDLVTGKTRAICSFRITENLYWSADGTRLYLTGHDSRTSQGAYIVDVAQAFGASRN